MATLLPVVIFLRNYWMPEYVYLHYSHLKGGESTNQSLFLPLVQSQTSKIVDFKFLISSVQAR